MKTSRDIATNHTLSFIEECTIPSPGKILEVGCGLGHLVQELAKKGHAVTAIDIEMKPTEIMITTDQSKFDLDIVYGLLSQTHWGADRSFETVVKSLKVSLCFGAFKNGKQVGLGRVITDYATTAYICDMVVAPELRGHGTGTKIMEAILSHPDLQKIKWILRTRDAATLYAKFGFKEAVFPGRYMEMIAHQDHWDSGGY